MPNSFISMHKSHFDALFGPSAQWRLKMLTYPSKHPHYWHRRFRDPQNTSIIGTQIAD